MNKKEKFSAIFIILILFTIIQTVSMSAIATEDDLKSKEAVRLLNSDVIVLNNSYIEIAVSQAGKFTIGTTGGDPAALHDENKVLLFGHPDPGTSFTTIRIDDSNFEYGSSGASVDTPIISDNSIVSKWRIKDIDVTQRLSLVKSSSGYADTVRISYTVENKGNRTHRVGTRIMMDTMLGNNDAAPFRIPGYGSVTKETQFNGSRIPQEWLAYDSLSSPTVSSRGILKTTKSIAPDKFVLSNWGRIYNTKWDFKPIPEDSNGDSAVGIWWYPENLESGQSRKYTTYYGIAYIQITPKVLTLGLNSHSSVHPGNTFTITSFIENTGDLEAKGVNVNLSLPYGLKLVSGETLEKSIGNLKKHDSGQASWKVKADGSAIGVLVYQVTATSTTTGIEPTIAYKQVNVIPEPIPPVPELSTALLVSGGLLVLFGLGRLNRKT